MWPPCKFAQWFKFLFSQRKKYHNDDYEQKAKESNSLSGPIIKRRWGSERKPSRTTNQLQQLEIKLTAEESNKTNVDTRGGHGNCKMAMDERANHSKVIATNLSSFSQNRPQSCRRPVPLTSTCDWQQWMNSKLAAYLHELSSNSCIAGWSLLIHTRREMMFRAAIKRTVKLNISIHNI